jgi:twitching motility protein PilT
LDKLITDPESLGIVQEMVRRPFGLILVTGPTGSGKTTTLYSALAERNEPGVNISTAEDPIEYTLPGLTQVQVIREKGMDFAMILRAFLRQDPDVILVGEMRDLETASAALTVAETGHLVLTTGHAPSASQAVERIANMFPPHERTLAQTRLASLLLGILCQALVPKVDGKGRVAAIEVMLANSAIRNLIRDGKTYQIPNTIRMSTQQGMELLDQALVRLYKSNIIILEKVFEFCNDRDEISRLTGEKDEFRSNEKEPAFAR